MLTRRALAAALPVALAVLPAAAAAEAGFPAFLAGLRAEAAGRGIRPAVLDQALSGLRPDPTVLQRDRHQPEFTMTWAHYRHLLVTPARIAAGKQAFQAHRGLFRQVADRFGVDPAPILGIWGIESNYGTTTGDFHIIDALATLAWGSGRAGFFRAQLLDALHILNDGDIGVAAMTGSWAGAMGQPQFMPSAYLRYAVDITGSGRRNIWTSVPDVIASIANYLAHSGWRRGQAWGVAARAPAGLAAPGARDAAAWRRDGVVTEGVPPPGPLRLVRPAGAGGPAFLAGANFAAIRRYNPSDFYALAVALVGQRIVA